MKFQNKYLSTTAILSVAVIWGSAFVIMKDSLHRQDVYSFLASRFILAALIMIAIRPQALRHFSKKFLFRGTIIGGFLAAGYIFQTLGLTMTTVAKTGFITGLYSVFTPLIAAGILRDRVSKIQWGSVLLAAVGLGFLAFNGLSMGQGELLVLISSLCFAAHIVALSHWSKGTDTWALTTIQMMMVGGVNFLFSLKNGFQMPPDTGVWSAVIYTALFASAYGFIVQTWSQSFMSATTVGVIFTTEYIFAAIFGVLYGHEHLTSRVLVGGVLVMIALYIITWDEGRTPQTHLHSRERMSS